MVHVFFYVVYVKYLYAHLFFSLWRNEEKIFKMQMNLFEAVLQNRTINFREVENVVENVVRDNAGCKDGGKWGSGHRDAFRRILIYHNHATGIYRLESFVLKLTIFIFCFSCGFKKCAKENLNWQDFRIKTFNLLTKFMYVLLLESLRCSLELKNNVQEKT